MAVLIGASGDYLKRTANLPTSTAFTMACWFYYAAERSAWAYFMGLEDATSLSTKYNLIGFSNTNAFQIESNGGVSFATNPATSAWHFMALVGDAVNLTGYHWTAAGVLQTASRANQTFTTALMSFGNDGYSEWVNCRLAAMKVWNAALTQAELELEMNSIRPVRFANLNLWAPGYPGATERIRDYSGNGYDLTGGTLTDEDPPPVPWGANPYFISSFTIEGTTVWGHVTGVTETNVRTFAGNWTGTGTVENSGDTERLALGAGEYMESEVVNTSTRSIKLLQNTYSAGNTVTIKYRTGASESACRAAGWSTYTVPFDSTGYVQIRVEAV
jgi:hypothetical protein